MGVRGCYYPPIIHNFFMRLAAPYVHCYKNRGLSLPLTNGLLTLLSTAYEYCHPLPPVHHDGPGILHLGMLVTTDLRVLAQPWFFTGGAGLGAQHVSDRCHCRYVLQQRSEER